MKKVKRCDNCKYISKYKGGILAGFCCNHPIRPYMPGEEMMGFAPCDRHKFKTNEEEKTMIQDSGERREFESGAVRDINVGKGNWVPVIGYEELYEISYLGAVRSLRKKTRIADKRRGIMRLKTDNHGYFRVNLYKDGKCKSLLISRLVALAFIPNKNNLPYVGHDNDIKKDNMVKNLYWTNARENLMHNGLHLKIAKKRNIARVIEALSIPIIGISETGEEISFSSMQEAQRNGFQSSKISMCVNGKRKHHKGYIWYRKDGVYGNCR